MAFLIVNLSIAFLSATAAIRVASVRTCSHLHRSQRFVTTRCSVASAGDALVEGSEVFGLTPPELSLLAPCKVNLFLRILRKRDDGFHELASLFQAVSLYDTLDFWELPPDESESICSMEVSPSSLGREEIPTDESNLVMKALKLFAERSGERRRIHCRLTKATPAQGGLGGGSADAATALFAANRLAGYPVSQEDLIVWAGELGSDIGFFLSRGSAYCTGRGEFVEFLDPLPSAPIYLINPEGGCSTPAVFKALGLTPGQELPGPEPSTMLDAFYSDINEGTFLNDLEEPAYEVLPMLRELRDELRHLGFPQVMLSGSGSTIFAMGEPGNEAWREELQAKFEGVQIFEQRFCSRGEDPKLWYEE